jgi:hypothetical protein
MRHAIIVVGSKKQREEPVPDVVLRDSEALRTTTWLANMSQQESAQLLDDMGNVFVRALLAPILAYRFYLLVHNTKLWSGKRPLVFVRGRSFSSRIAAYAGTWGSGDVVKADQTDAAPLGPTRFVIGVDGRLELCEGERSA